VVIEIRLQRDGSLVALCPRCGGRERFMLVDRARVWSLEHGCAPERPRDEHIVTA